MAGYRRHSILSSEVDKANSMQVDLLFYIIKIPVIMKQKPYFLFAVSSNTCQFQIAGNVILKKVYTAKTLYTKVYKYIFGNNIDRY